MSWCIIHNPGTVLQADDPLLQSTLIANNIRLLRDASFPAVVIHGITNLLGDPNSNLSAEVCEMLVEAGFLSKQSWGRLPSDKSEVFYYTWETELDVGKLTLEQLTLLAWDLRHHPNFCHVSYVTEYKKRPLHPETSLDSSEEESHSSETE